MMTLTEQIDKLRKANQLIVEVWHDMLDNKESLEIAQILGESYRLSHEAHLKLKRKRFNQPLGVKEP